MQNTLKIIALVGKFAGIVAGLASYGGMLPEKWAPVGVIIFGAASILKDCVNRLGDLLDDGKANDSFKPQ